MSNHSTERLESNLPAPPPNFNTSIRQPPIAFEPTYVLAYGPFDAMDQNEPNDPSLWPIDYCAN